MMTDRYDSRANTKEFVILSKAKNLSFSKCHRAEEIDGDVSLRST